MKKFFLLMAILISMPINAGDIGWTGYSKVIEIVVTAKGGINVRLSPDVTGCVSQSGYGGLYASIYPSHPGINNMQSTLLSAYMADKDVRLYLSDETCKVLEVRLGGR